MLTRRKIMKSAAVVAVTATLGFPAKAKGGDAELFAMNRKLEAATVKENDTFKAYSDAEAAALKESGPRPKDPVGGEEYKRAKAAYLETQECAMIKHGVEAAYRRSEEAIRRRDAIEAELLAMPAATIAGMLLKARIADRCICQSLYFEEGQPEFAAVRGLLADLERRAAVEAATA